MEIKLRVDVKRLTLDDLVGFEDNDLTARFVRSVISRFMINPETDDYYTADQGIKAAGALSFADAEEAVKVFADQVKEAKASAIPPPKGGN